MNYQLPNSAVCFNARSVHFNKLLPISLLLFRTTGFSAENERKWKRKCNIVSSYKPEVLVNLQNCVRIFESANDKVWYKALQGV